ncbi:ATP-binding protein [Candidatus Synechococcus calcipolaris G9]|uniref:histidine kinase n=1 Tax=Candidatus Synechococcus calcipolaris G9 TaxID=1497997 RepID=A0ABT6F224_9SYNE|nr:ATP-binding protein [Candidatus Synechococcus calcipolaris]MDG2991914.1 ATP-binding protein [Candidatus Synechococcus calcipolaris G9]
MSDPQAIEAGFRSIFENAVEGIFQTDLQGNYIRANQALAQIYGYASADELIAVQPNARASLYVDPQRRQQFIDLMAQQDVLSNFESQVYRQDGSIIWIAETCRVVRDRKNNIIYYEGFVRDISEQQSAFKQLKMAEASLQQKNRELADTLNELQNTQKELIHSEKMAALGQLVAGVAHEINTPLGAIRSSIETISLFSQRTLPNLPDILRELPPELFERFTALRQLPIQDTLQLSSRERRQYKRKMMAVLNDKDIQNSDGWADTFIDIGVLGDIDPFLLLLQSEQGEQVVELAHQLALLERSTHTIGTAIERAAKVVFALKTYARFDQSGEKVTANIIDGIETVLTLYHNKIKHGVEVVRHYDAIPAIPCYPDELTQVWTNLVHNALQAMDERGELRIRVRQQERALRVDITDSGCGIPDSVLPHIFEPFFTTKPSGEGNGLGLDIVHKIVDKHQGTIEVDSQPGKTTFSVTLPLIEDHGDHG